MIVQSLPPSEPKTSGQGRTSSSPGSANESFARALAESIQVAGSTPGSHPRADLRTSGLTRRAPERGDDRPGPDRRRLDAARRAPARHRGEARGGDTPIGESDRPGRQPGPVESRATGRAGSAPNRAGGVTADRASGDPVTADPATGHPVTADPATGHPVTADPATGDPVAADGVGNSAVTTDPVDDGARPAAGPGVETEPELAAALAALLGVDSDTAARFVGTLAGGLTAARGAEGAGRAMARLASLAGPLLAVTGTGVGDGNIDPELLHALTEAAVDAGLVDETVADLDGGPASVLATLSSVLADRVSEAGNPISPSENLGSINRTGDPLPDSDVGSSPDPGSIGGAGAEPELPAPADGGHGSGTGGGSSDNPVLDGDPSTGGLVRATGGTPGGADSPSPVDRSVAGVGGVASGGNPSAARSATATAPGPAPTQGLVELANARLAEQLRPAFAAVRRGIDGLDELQLRLRNDGGAPIRVDISTADSEVRVVLSGTNDDVMQRLGQERERLADELRRAGFTSTSIDVQTENGAGGGRRAATTGGDESDAATHPAGPRTTTAGSTDAGTDPGPYPDGAAVDPDGEPVSPGIDLDL